MCAMVCRPKVMPVGLRPTPRSAQAEVGRHIKNPEPEEPQQMEEGEQPQHLAAIRHLGGYKPCWLCAPMCALQGSLRITQEAVPSGGRN